jgi:hypothetical protein
MSTASPDYGCGKLTVEAVPVAGTFPSTGPPDLSGLTFDIRGPIASSDIEYADGVEVCTTVANPTGRGATCPESTYGVSPSTYNFGSWVSGAAYSVNLDTTSTSKAAPAGTLIPTISGTFPDCTAYQGASGASGCADTATVKVYGANHQLALKVVNSATGKPLAGATYELCSPVSTAPTPTPGSCPVDSTGLAAATSGTSGILKFPSRYPGAANYSVVETAEPDGYKPHRSQAWTIQPVTTPADAGTQVGGLVKLAPTKTALVTHVLHTTEHKKVAVNAFAGATRVFNPLKLIKLGTVKHGIAHHSGGRIAFTPKAGFIGTVTFTYTVRNALGAKSTGKIVVHVRA